MHQDNLLQCWPVWPVQPVRPPCSWPVLKSATRTGQIPNLSQSRRNPCTNQMQSTRVFAWAGDVMKQRRNYISYFVHVHWTIGSSLRPAQLETSTRMVILIRTHTKKYTKGDSIKKFFAGYVGWLTRTICTKIGDNWINGTGNIDRFVFPTPSLLENKMRKNVFSVQKWLIWGENKRIFPGGMNKITFHQLNQRFSVSISVRRELPIDVLFCIVFN